MKNRINRYNDLICIKKNFIPKGSGRVWYHW